MNQDSTLQVNPKPKVMSLVFGGLLPIIAFTVIEEYYGPFYGLIAAPVFGLGELTYEKIKSSIARTYFGFF